MSKPVDVGSLKEGKYVIIDGEPCRIVSYAKSKPGKHGSAKARVVAIGIFDGKRRSIVKPADEEIEVPIIEKRGAQVIAILGDHVQLMDLETYETFEVPMPEDENLKERIKEGAEVIYWDIVGRKMIVQTKGE